AARHPSLISHLILISAWSSGARWFTTPDVRIATAGTARDDREWRLFSSVQGSVATAFEDAELGRQIAAAIQQATSPEGLFAYYLAVPTIERHLVNVYTKIGARGRADATAYAVRHGLD